MNKILITSIGRTGTKSLSAYLDSIPNVRSYHEREKQDISYLFLSQLETYSNYANNYLINRDSLISKEKEEVYIDVNPYLRFANFDLLASLGWKSFFIVRHPKTYLESVYKRSLFSKNDTSLSQMPKNEDPINNDWFQLSRFQKLCWYYAAVHKHVLSSNIPFYKMEDLINKPHIVKELIVDLGIDLKLVTSFNLPKTNSSTEYILKNKVKSFIKGEENISQTLEWDTLSTEEINTYLKYCKPLLKPLGYAL